MGRMHISRLIFLLLLAAALSAACGLPAQLAATPTPTGAAVLPGLPQAGGNSGGIGAGNGGSDGGNGSGNGNGNGAVDPANPANVTPTPSPTPDANVFYDVKQVITLGGEAISGMVCSTIAPFSVLSVTPKVTFTFNFVPSSNVKGSFAYAYNLSKAGETHDANGTYSLSKPDPNGTLHLSMTGKDHVVFKGFDGNLPVRYNFDLAPSQKAKCMP